MKVLVFIGLFYSISFSQIENSNFNYKAYVPTDFDSLMENTPKAVKTVNKNIKSKPYDLVNFKKIKLTAYLISTPIKLDPEKDFGPFGNIYQKTLEKYGMPKPPAISCVLKVKTVKGREVTILMQNVLADVLLAEGYENAKMEIYGWHYMNDEDGAMVVMAEFKIQEHKNPNNNKDTTKTK
jgi:hypothetical protein